jgi:hypothetical protein
MLLEPKWSSTEVQVECTAEKVAKIAEMDNPATMEELAAVGAKAAAIQVKPEHFEGFDIRG